MATRATMTELAASFHEALADPAAVRTLLTADEVGGLEVYRFPASMRQGSARSQLQLLLTMRSVLGDLIARPDVKTSGRTHLVEPDVDDAADHDIVHDVVVEPGDLDLEVPPSVALARFGMHASPFGGVDPDPLYAPQMVLVAGHGAGGHLVLLQSYLTAPMHDTEIALPSSDVRDDLEALRQRIWRRYAHDLLVGQLAG